MGIEVSFQGCSFYIWMFAIAENTSSLASGMTSIPMPVKFNNDVHQQVMAMQGMPKQINIFLLAFATTTSQKNQPSQKAT